MNVESTLHSSPSTSGPLHSADPGAVVRFRVELVAVIVAGQKRIVGDPGVRVAKWRQHDV